MSFINHASKAKLAQNARTLLTSMQDCANETVDDSQVLPKVLKLCNQMVEKNFLLTLLAMVQSVERDPNNGFAPCENSTEV
mmetsp:Transcript_2365/g.3299  ORF Transcript_2365/g.3299 Transcript_2365/m.3299 type:complete len:81 (+) Transcript_2365:277-519(+)